MSSLWAGRFAPTPSGPLHFGSLVAALGSYIVARQRQGLWLMRIEDIDPPREMPGAAKDILNTLAAFGFEWDGEVVYQSQRQQAYLQAQDYLEQRSLLYLCDCSRKTIFERNQGVYDKYCRERGLSCLGDSSVRIKFEPEYCRFHDQILGECLLSLPENQQDFVVRRRDGLFAYQLAVVVDDIEQGVNHVVRGADILDSTPRQNFLYHCFQKRAPQYFHLPLVIDTKGQKLSKSNLSPAVASDRATSLLMKAYRHLGQSCDDAMCLATPQEFLRWAVENFELKLVGVDSVVYSEKEFLQPD